MKLLGKSTIPINASEDNPYSCFYYCTYPKQQEEAKIKKY